MFLLYRFCYKLFPYIFKAQRFCITCVTSLATFAYIFAIKFSCRLFLLFLLLKFMSLLFPDKTSSFTTSLIILLDRVLCWKLDKAAIISSSKVIIAYAIAINCCNKALKECLFVSYFKGNILALANKQYLLNLLLYNPGVASFSG